MARPAPRFHDYIGQRPAVAFLRNQLDGALARGRPLPHTLLLGPSGMGKTMLARALAAAMGTAVIAASGADDRKALVAKLRLLKPSDIFFIDEAHRLASDAQECLYEPIDDNSVAGPARAGAARDERIDDPPSLHLPPFSLILATDQPGRLLNALYKRITHQVYLLPYSVAELKAIVEAQASKLNLLLTAQAAGLVAEHAAGIPRRAEHLLQGIRLHFSRDEMRPLGVPEVRQYLQAAGFDEFGLEPIAQLYLSALDAQGTASLETLALCLGVDAPHVKSQVEATLVRRGLVKIARTGRQLTEAGQELMRSRTAAAREEEA
jgi:Holliday junction DNA helicase RuvB